MVTDAALLDDVCQLKLERKRLIGRITIRQFVYLRHLRQVVAFVSFSSALGLLISVEELL